MKNKNIGACILAAGYSSRMDAFKALLPLGGGTVIETVISAVKESGIQQIAVVTGYNREALKSVIERENVTEAFNSSFDQGMFSSVRAGIASLPENLDGFFVVPVDCPLVGTDTLTALMDALIPGEDNFYVPCFRGKKGHPLLISAHYRTAILEYQGKDGLKAITNRDYEKMRRIEVDREGVLLDMDTPEEYEAVKQYLAAGCKSHNLYEMAKDRRFFFIRHGQIQQHKEPIFLGQTDVSLSKLGLEQADDAGDRLRKYKPETDIIYTSDLQRAVQTARCICDQVGGLQLDLQQGLREMNLGPWDGQAISTVKEQYPQEYTMRGAHLLTYKLGHGSENFYDLQYRVCRTMISILKKDSRRDVIVVAHSGVLHGLSNGLRGKDISQPWEKLKNGEMLVIDGGQNEYI